MKENIFANSKKAFSLIELMFSLVILVIILVGLLYTYVVCFKLNESSRSLILVNNAMQAHLETIRDDFDDLTTSQDVPFALEGFSSGDGVIFRSVCEEDCTGYNNLKLVRLVACWKEGKRIIGEGVALDSGGNLVSNGAVTSNSELVTLISRED
ncbi:MAG: prepilin-type N-terminal cleavage/methylation domain-containing protein [Candidatus Omnitrophota bacterium]